MEIEEFEGDDGAASGREHQLVIEWNQNTEYSGHSVKGYFKVMGSEIGLMVVMVVTSQRQGKRQV